MGPSRGSGVMGRSPNVAKAMDGRERHKAVLAGNAVAPPGFSVIALDSLQALLRSRRYRHEMAEPK